MSDYARKVGASVATVSLCARGKRTPPEGTGERWADGFDLVGAAREEFVAASNDAKAHAQRRAGPRLKELEEANADLRAAARALAELLQSRGVQIPKRTRDLLGL